MKGMNKKAHGFTIVELLIVIVVIGILAAITIVAYNGVQSRARDAARVSDINKVQKQIELYYADTGEYPKTTDDIYLNSTTTTRTDANCHVGSKSTDWVPGLGGLPQSSSNEGKGISSGGKKRGCYVYVSDGKSYVLSAWNNIESGPQTSTLYRRIGFREMGWFDSSGNRAYCNHVAIGGVINGSYDATKDYYKHSYTVSNVTSCNETPPAGA